MFVGDDAHARAQRVVAGAELADHVADPADDAVVGQHDLVGRGLRQPGGALLDFDREHFLRGGVERLGFGTGGGGGVGCEHEPVEPADHVAFDSDFASLTNFCFKHCVLS